MEALITLLRESDDLDVLENASAAVANLVTKELGNGIRVVFVLIANAPMFIFLLFVQGTRLFRCGGVEVLLTLLRRFLLYL